MTTHQQLANRLGTSVTTVAFIREIRAGMSPHSQRALAEQGGDVLEAARWLAGFRKCWTAFNETTSEIVEGVREADG